MKTLKQPALEIFSKLLDKNYIPSKNRKICTNTSLPIFSVLCLARNVQDTLLSIYVAISHMRADLIDIYDFTTNLQMGNAEERCGDRVVNQSEQLTF